VGDHLERIDECWKKPTTGSIVEISKACCKANNELNSNSKKQLVAALPFDMSSFCKYAQIGADARLTTPDKRDLLPGKMLTMYELHQLTDDEFHAFEAEGLLTPGLRRADVTKWRIKWRGEPQKTTLPPKLPSIFYAALKPKRLLANTEMSKIGDDLAALAERFEMDVVYPETKPDGNWEKAQAQIRRKAKKIVDDYFRPRRKKIGRNLFAGRPHLQKYAGFAVDDVEIEPDADEERILDVLRAIDREDEFEPIRNAAYKEYDLDATHEAPEWMEAVADKPPPTAALAEDMDGLRQHLEAAKSKSTRKRSDFTGFK
jgi:hypothetical protein